MCGFVQVPKTVYNTVFPTGAAQPLSDASKCERKRYGRVPRFVPPRNVDRATHDGMKHFWTSKTTFFCICALALIVLIAEYRRYMKGATSREPENEEDEVDDEWNMVDEEEDMNLDQSAGFKAITFSGDQEVPGKRVCF
ncbi:unnamed protein product [Heligmosomoides polygyrus]|uniref:Membrane protein FAM174B n=1 Tax=Heligmosomoides polygyrus TaxID=6339 RepID=A0A183GF78_HELPZ|nr:unnamed protein product [Heligmosomoides polygyrus]